VDLQETLQFAGEGKVGAHYSTDTLENIKNIFDAMKEGRIDDRVVMEF
jgi:alcohol dehydrogenase, propanol-preferring